MFSKSSGTIDTLAQIICGANTMYVVKKNALKCMPHIMCSVKIEIFQQKGDFFKYRPCYFPVLVQFNGVLNI